MKTSNINQDILHELFEYKDGQLLWAVSKGGVFIGSVAGTIRATGYIAVSVNRTLYLAHRLIWMWHNGDIPEGFQIDHIDRNPSNNNIENLRIVTQQENMWNTKAKGCSWHKAAKKWQASICAHGKRQSLGLFDNEKDAHQAYLDAKNKLHVFKVAV